MGRAQRVVVMGSAGLLGRALLAAGASPQGVVVTGLDLPDVDITDRESVGMAMAEHRPQVIINAAGYTNVDRAEAEPAAAMLANGTGPAVLACACEQAGVELVHVSTDHVFGGEAREPYRVEAEPAPRGIYALSKLAGEQAVRAVCRRHWVVRTAGLYGPGGRNFVAAILDRAERGLALRVVDDQVCQRTYVRDLAAGLWSMVEQQPAYGVYHYANRGESSWYEFAGLVLASAGVNATCAPVSTAEWGAPAPRPAYSVLDLTRWSQAGLSELRNETAALEDYLSTREAGGA